MSRGLTARALFALLRYDLSLRIFGFERIKKQLARQKMVPRPMDPEATARVCAAVNLAACFYVKPVLCLQKSVVTVALLRESGVAARMVVGHRASPFFSHAWVEVEDRVVNDSPVYQKLLKVLWVA